MKSKESKLYQQVDEILWNDWDPIGVKGFAPRDEYQMYLPSIYKMLVDNATVNDIARKLGQIATERMGLSSNPDFEMKVAQKLIIAKNESTI